MEMTALVVTEVTEVMAMMVAGIQLLVGTGHSEDGGMVGYFVFVLWAFLFFILLLFCWEHQFELFHCPSRSSFLLFTR